MKTYLSLIAAALVLAVGAHAQERTAGQANDAQVNWSALSGQIDLISNQNKAIAALVGKMATCNAKGMVYAPTAVGKDGDDCISAGEYKGPLIAGGKTGDDCMDSGGRPKNIGSGYICLFGGSSCQLGWSNYGNWTATQKTTCRGFGNYGSGCQTLGHGFGNTPAETCTYGISVAHGSGGDSSLHNADPGKATCSAQAILRGCI